MVSGMVYNSLDYMGMPLDVLIKSFRESGRSGRHFSSVADAATAFLDFLRTDLDIAIEAEDGNIDGLLVEEFRLLTSRVVQRVGNEIRSEPSQRRRSANTSITLNFTDVFSSVID